MSSRALKVLFLTRYPLEGASSRYRVYQYLPHLQALGVHCVTQAFMDSTMYETYFSPGRPVRKLWLMIKALLRRLAMLSKFSDYDIIYMQRELFPLGPPVYEKYMKYRGALLVYDYDDALFIPKPSRYNPLASYLRSPGKTFELFRLVDCVVAGNDWLRDQARARGACAVTVEVAEDTDRIPMHSQHNNDGPVTIGWLGSTSTVKYLELIAPALRRIAREFPGAVQFEAMGGGDFHMQGVPWVNSRWTLEGELEALSRFDIGLMPLPEEDWAQGKSGGKARTYMAAGVVPVCTAIGYNLELIQHRHTGYLCRSDEEWYRALRTLIQAPLLRQEIAVAARELVVNRFPVRQQAARLRQLFDDLLARRAG